MTSPATCLKGHSCEKRSSNYVLDLDLKIQTYFSSILNYFFSNERSPGLHCYGSKRIGCCYCCCCCCCCWLQVVCRQDCLENALNSAPVQVGSEEHWSTLADDPASSMFEKTFMWKMFVWFGPENASILNCKKTALSTYFWTLQEDGTWLFLNIECPCLLQFFSSLHFCLYWHQVSYFHACRGHICQFPLVPVRSPRLLEQISCADASP